LLARGGDLVKEVLAHVGGFSNWSIDEGKPYHEANRWDYFRTKEDEDADSEQWIGAEKWITEKNIPA